MRPAARFLALLALAALAAGTARAQVVDIEVYWALGCPHCDGALDALAARARLDPDLRVRRLEVTLDADARRRFIATNRRLGIAEPAVPLIVGGARQLIGWGGEAASGPALDALIAACRADLCPAEDAPERAANTLVQVPLLGTIDAAALSLPALTVVLAAIDGFNPCAMWVLVFLLGLLVGLRDRWRMWALGTAFIVASAGVYYLFLAAWLNLLLFIGVVAWVRAGIGLVALAGGGWYLREFLVNPAATCRVTGSPRRQRVFASLRATALQRDFLPALAGIVALAVAVNLVELVCSAGIPAVYTQVLALNAVGGWTRQAYLLLYILVFMLDDLAVFVAAMTTLRLLGFEGRYAHLSHLLGGLVMIAIGIALLLRPQWLAFA